MRLVERLGTTIAAIATAPGSVIGIIRISGPHVRQILTKVCGRLPSPRRVAVRRLTLGEQNSPEQAVVLFFSAPASYTGEDLAEIQVHGAIPTLSTILEHLFSLGARPALPGEFSFRAVVNGKMSLAQATALATLISAQNRFQSEFARREMLFDHFDRAVGPLLSRWDEVEALAVALIDFPDQIFDHLPPSRISLLVADTETLVSRLLENSRRFERLAGARVLIVGCPNVGKSSLFNRILGHERAIVSPEPGTTRDYISGKVLFPDLGLEVEICDSAGVREAAHGIEGEGVSRTLALTEVSTQIIFVFDGSAPPTAEDRSVLDLVSRRNPIVVANKSDLGRHPAAAELAPSLFVSAHTGEGIGDLLTMLSQRFSLEAPDPSLPLLFHQTRRQIAEDLLEICAATRAVLDTGDAALIADALSRCRRCLRDLAGKADDLSVYDRIFASFCLGK